MNIFAVDHCPYAAAKALGDRHVVKMTLETAQMLCSIFPVGEAQYRRTHYNHPCTVWSRECFANYEWLYHHGMALAATYTEIYGKEHKSQAVISKCWSQVGTNMFSSDCHMTPFAQAMPEEFKGHDPVEAYRRYYAIAKHHLHQYTRRGKPSWLDNVKATQFP
jgi:hypothetical protein